jgi:hypothetical protein
MSSHKKLSESYHWKTLRRDEKGYPWGFFYDGDRKTNKMFYAISDSWLDTHFFHQVFYNDFPEYFLVNRASRGLGNSQMIDMVRQDLDLLKRLDVEVVFLVVFTEVGRRNRDFGNASPKNFTSTHDYFGSIMKSQHDEIKELVKNYPHHITTGFVNNNFNQNKSILDFCGKSSMTKPNNVFTVVSNGIYDFLKDRNNIFKFNFADDVKKSLDLKNYMDSLECVDETYHPDRYKVYEDFLENVFLNLQNNKNML